MHMYAMGICNVVMLCVHLLSADHIHIPTCIHNDSMGRCLYIHLATRLGIYIYIHRCGLRLVYLYTFTEVHTECGGISMFIV